MTPAAETVGLLARELDAEYAGVGMRGLLFRSPGRRRCHRVILNDQLDAVQRSELGEWRRRPRRAGIAPVVKGDRGDQQEISGRWYQVVTYETSAETSLADRLAAKDPLRRLRSVEAVLRALPGWWDGIGDGILPMPSDIVFERGAPVLLPLPAWGPPPVGEFLAESERILHLSPAAARGIAGDDRARGLHSIAVAALRCLDTLPESSPASLLRLVACADLVAARRTASRLPLWMTRTGPVERVRAMLRAQLARETSPDADFEPVAIAEALRRARRAMDPLTTLNALREDGRHREAVDLAHAVLLDEPDIEVMMFAADIARTDLVSPLEALSFLERVVQADPARTEAYAAQLSLVFDPATARLGSLHSTLDGSFASRLDQTVRTAFEKLPEPERRERAHDMAAYWLRRGAFAEANVFAHQWLYDGPTLMWARFGLMLDYAESFLRLGKAEPAQRVADEVKQGLRRIRDNGHMTQREIHGHGRRLAALQIEIHTFANRKEPR